jgi:integrase
MMPLDAVALAALRRFRRQQAGERLALGEKLSDSDVIASNELGEPISPETWGHHFERLTKKAEPRAIRLHDLRHTAATLMHESATVSLRTLAAMLGHADPGFTLRTYAEKTEESMKAASATLASLFDARPEKAV